MSSTESKADCGSPANGAALRTSASSVVDRPRRRRRPSTRCAGRARPAGCAGTRSGLDLAGDHPLGHDGRLHEVAAVLREHHAVARRTDLVTGATDALQAAGDGRRRLDLDDQVHRAHVDAELEARRGDDGGQPAGFQLLLDERALLLRDRAVVGAGEDRVGSAGRAGLRHDLGGCDGRVGEPGVVAEQALGMDLVEARAQPLGEPARVREHDRRAVRLDQVGDPLLDVRPDGQSLRLAGCRPGQARRSVRPSSAMSSTGTTDLDVDPLVGRRLDDLDVACRAQEPGDLLDRAYRGRQPDPPGRRGPAAASRRSRLSARCAPRLVPGDRVHLVDDHRLAPRAAPRARTRSAAGTATPAW